MPIKKLMQPGFTIVEVLIVIVVIAILASISIVAYNGIQDRARSVVWTSALNQWEEILLTYSAIEKTLPTTGPYSVCLGKNFPASDGFAVDQCVRSVPAEFLTAGTYSALNTAIEEVVGTVPQTLLPVVKTVDPAAGNREGYVRGLLYHYSGSDHAWIEYYLDAETGSDGCFEDDSLEYGNYANGSLRCRRYLN